MYILLFNNFSLLKKRRIIVNKDEDLHKQSKVYIDSVWWKRNLPVLKFDGKEVNTMLHSFDGKICHSDVNKKGRQRKYNCSRQHLNLDLNRRPHTSPTTQ